MLDNQKRVQFFLRQKKVVLDLENYCSFAEGCGMNFEGYWSGRVDFNLVIDIMRTHIIGLQQQLKYTTMFSTKT